MATTFDLAPVTDNRTQLWLQIVPSKSGGQPHSVRAWQSAGGAIGFTCDCKAFEYRGKCSHIATGKSQEMREALAYEAYQQHEPSLADPTFDDARALLANAPTDFDSGEPVVVPTKRKITAAQAYDDVYGAA